MERMATPSQQASRTQDMLMSRRISVLDPTEPHTFITPVKRINIGQDVDHFLTTKAYSDIVLFIMQLNIAMCPKKDDGAAGVQTLKIASLRDLPEPVRKLRQLLRDLEAIIEEAPPDSGPRRFGNLSFRKWHEIVESRTTSLLQAYLPTKVLEFARSSANEVSALDELTSYFLGGFGSAQRLDYGTGHELSFLAFLGCIWKLGGFTETFMPGEECERSIVLGIIEPYLAVVRHLILTYTLEPAGSHGVWGLDDHFFLSYILGSSQYCPAISEDEAMPIEGSLPNTPNPADVARKQVVDEERLHNMYFSAIGFINDVKSGPFWEHSPILFDISGVRSGWGKINKGMIKMYHAEVLAKFPVVQHFPFGSLLSWERDPLAAVVAPSVHTTAHPLSSLSGRSVRGIPSAEPPRASTTASWAKSLSNPTGGTTITAPRAPPASTLTRTPPLSFDEPTRAPWVKR